MIGLFVVFVIRGRVDQSTSEVPLFTLPADLSPFSVLALLRRIQTSQAIALTDEQRQTLLKEVRSLERETFSQSDTPPTTNHLETIARRWLDTALTA